MSRPLASFRDAAVYVNRLASSVRTNAWEELAGAESLGRDYLTVADAMDSPWLDDGIDSALLLHAARDPGIDLSPQPSTLATLPFSNRRGDTDGENVLLNSLRHWREPLALESLVGAFAPGRHAFSTIPFSFARSAMERAAVVSRGLVPDLHTAVDTARKRLGLTFDVEVLVAPEGGFAVWADLPLAAPGRSHVRLFVGAEAINRLDVAALTFLVGKELAAAWFLLPAAEGARPNPYGGLLPGMRQCLHDRWRRLAEIGSDRAGYVACRDFTAAARAILVSGTGLDPDRFGADPEALLRGLSDDDEESRARPASGSLPLRLRLQALRKFVATLGNDMVPVRVPDSVEEEVTRLLGEAERKPPAGSLQEAFMEVVALGGVAILSADREVRPEEICRLLELLYEHFTDSPEHVVPMGGDNTQPVLDRALERVRAEASDDDRSFLGRLLAAVATSDREIRESEVRTLEALVGRMGRE